MLIPLQNALSSMPQPHRNSHIKIIKSYQGSYKVSLLSQETLTQEGLKTDRLSKKILKIEDALADSKKKYYIDTKVLLQHSSFYQACEERNSKTMLSLYHLENIDKISEVMSLNMMRWVSEGGSIDFFRSLYQVRKYYIEDVDYSGSTTLHLACKNKHHHLVQFLVECKKDLLHEPDDYGDTPLHAACETGDLEIIKQVFLMDPSIVNHKNDQEETPFQACCKKGYLECAKWLLEQDPTLATHFNLENDQHCTPFEEACLNDDLEMAQWILSFNPALLNATDAEGASIFLLTCSKNNLKVAQWLLQIKPELLSNKTINGTNALHKACEYRACDVISWLCRDHEELMYESNSMGRFPFALLFTSPPSIKSLEIFILNDYQPQNRQEIDLLLVFLKTLPEDQLTSLLPCLSGSFISFILASFHPMPAILGPVVQQVKQHLPDRVQFRATNAVLPKGRDLIVFFNSHIDDISEITTPFDTLLSIFEKLDPLAFDDAKPKENPKTAQECALIKQNKLELIKALFAVLKENKPDAAVPKGEEAFYYLHLTKIGKHILSYLMHHPQKTEEALTILEDFVDSSGKCFANFSAKFYSIYQRIKEDHSFGEVAGAELDPSIKFMNTFKVFFTKQIKQETSKYLLNVDAHDSAIFFEFLQKHQIPHPRISPIADLPFQKEYRLHLIALRLGISSFSSNLEALIEKKFINFLSNKFLSPLFVFKLFRNFVNMGLEDQKDPGIFLEMLTSWLETHGLSAHEILAWDDIHESYSFKKKSIPKMLEKLPKDFKIEW